MVILMYQADSRLLIQPELLPVELLLQGVTTAVANPMIRSPKNVKMVLVRVALIGMAVNVSHQDIQEVVVITLLI